MLTKYAEGLLDAPLPADIATLLHELAARDPVDLQEAQNRWESIAFEDWEAQTVKIAWIAWWNLPPFSNG